MEKLAKDEDMAEFVDNSSPKHKDILDRVACLLSTKGADDFGISEEEMEQAFESSPTKYLKIAELIGDLFDDLQIEWEMVE